MPHHCKYNIVALATACILTILLGLSAVTVAKAQSGTDHHLAMMKNHVLSEINAHLDHSSGPLIALKISKPHGAFSGNTFQTRLTGLKTKIENDASMESLCADMNTLNALLYPPHTHLHGHK